MSYSIVMGIEIHLELKTESKMFTSAPSVFGAEPNTAITAADLALPGSLPTVNMGAVVLATRLSKALQMQVDPLLRFDRKNYFYSDLPKGYQITQQEFPIGSEGVLDILLDGNLKKIGIERLHLEEDTAKQFHADGVTRIDFNRSGSPLIEIVSHPDFRTGAEVAAYIETMRQLVVELGVSDGKMNEGSLRCDLNISIRPSEDAPFGTKVEVKNLNSIGNVVKAIEYEYERQVALIEQGEPIIMETRRFDEASQSTIGMRSKETVVDYRYFTEPNLIPTHIPQDILDYVVPELPTVRYQRLMSMYGLSAYDAEVLNRNTALVPYFETVAQKVSDRKVLVNYMNQDVLSYVNEHGTSDFETVIPVSHFVSFIQKLSDGAISSKQAKTVFEDMLEGSTPEASIEKHGMVQVSDDGAIIAFIETVFETYPQVIVDYQNGLDKAVKFAMGQVMKLSKGTVNPKRANELVVELLDKKL